MIDVTDMIRRPAIFRAKDVNSFERPRLFEEALSGAIIQHGRGLYSSTRYNISDAEALLFHSPEAIATLDTALLIHGLIDRPPKRIWISIEGKARRPRVPPLEIETLRHTSAPEQADVLTTRLSKRGPVFQVFQLPRLAVEFIRARNRIGTEHAYAMAVRIILHVDRGELMACAVRCGVARPMRHFLANPPPRDPMDRLRAPRQLTPQCATPTSGGSQWPSP